MKGSIWDVLTIVTLLALTGLCLLFLTLLVNPYSGINPFPPPTLPPTLALPTATSTLKSLPATWTPDAHGNIVSQSSPLRPSQTARPSPTGFVLPSFTPTATKTSTPTETPTITLTPTATNTFTITPNYAATNTYNTAVAAQKTVQALYAQQTQAAAVETNAAGTAAAVQATSVCGTMQAEGTPCP